MKTNTIRLTEAQLHRVIKESVNRILKEIGDTPKGQYMLGRLQQNKLFNRDDAREAEIGRYCDNQRENSDYAPNEMKRAKAKGFADQWSKNWNK